MTTGIHCGGAVRIVASIEDPTDLRAILDHVEERGAPEAAHYRTGPRAQPAAAAWGPSGRRRNREARNKTRCGNDPAGLCAGR